MIFDVIRARLAERTRATPMPVDAASLPERFRGRPVLAAPPDGGPDTAMTAAARTELVVLRRREPAIDLGRCLFTPEEAGSSAAGTVEFTRDYRMASRTREGLVSPDGAPELATALDERMRRLLGRSLRLRSVMCGSCGGCEAELNALSNVVFDMARFGIQLVASPRHADGIVITGVVNRNMREALERTWAAVPDPRIVIAVGACAVSGGPFHDGTQALGIPADIPVDVWIPGCPPHPLTLLDGLLRLMGRLGERLR